MVIVQYSPVPDPPPLPPPSLSPYFFSKAFSGSIAKAIVFRICVCVRACVCACVSVCVCQGDGLPDLSLSPSRSISLTLYNLLYRRTNYMHTHPPTCSSDHPGSTGAIRLLAILRAHMLLTHTLTKA